MNEPHFTGSAEIGEQDYEFVAGCKKKRAAALPLSRVFF
jgi:hypothetical protein